MSAAPLSDPLHSVQNAPPQAASGGGGTNVEVDEIYGQEYTDIDSGESTSTTSIASSVFSFTYANGRRYHSDRFESKYFMPNDEKEQDRLDLYHHIFLLLKGGALHAAHLDHPQKVLDIGTGTGIWAIDFADGNPQAEVIGTDLSPIQPSWVPPNCKFEVDDMELPWTYADNTFDYIHIRSMSGSFKNWPEVFRQAYNKLKPGGIVEYQDYGCEVFLADGTPLLTPHDEHPLATYMYEVSEASKKNGKPIIYAKHAKQDLENAGFIDIKQEVYTWPCGDWPKDKTLKEIGRFGLQGMLDSLYPFGVYLLTQQGWTLEQVTELCDKARKSLTKPNKNGKYYFQGWFVYGYKPQDEC